MPSGAWVHWRIKGAYTIIGEHTLVTLLVPHIHPKYNIYLAGIKKCYSPRNSKNEMQLGRACMSEPHLVSAVAALSVYID